MNEKDKSPLFLRTIALVRSIPKGKVLTYSAVANLVSARGCARHVSYILSSSSKKYGLPWHRVINSQGKISLPVQSGYFEQKKRLEKEKVKFNGEKIDLMTFQWSPTQKEVKSILKGLPKHIPAAAR